MSDTTCHMSISLDGFVAGPEQSRDNPLGRRGEELHGWHIGDPEPPYHAPVFVLTHHAHEPIDMQGGTTFHFVTDGFGAAYARALDVAAGNGVDIAAAIAPPRGRC